MTKKSAVTETQYMSTVMTTPPYANSARIYYSTHFCRGHNTRKNCIYKRSYMTSCMFITIKHKIIHQCLTDGTKQTHVFCEI